MKISLDTKFFATATITLIILIVAIAVLNAIVGSVAATVAGTVLGALAVKFFDKLDYSPKTHLEIVSPLPQLSSVFAGIFILFGSVIFILIAKDLFRIVYGADYFCRPIALIFLVILDWGGFALAGWLIGSIFSNHAMRITAIAGFFLVIILTLRSFSGEHADVLRLALKCLLGQEPNKEEFELTLSGSKFGGLIGSIARAYIAIVMARISSSKKLNEKIETS